MLLGFLEGFGLGVSEEEGERGRFDILVCEVVGVVVGRKVVGAWSKKVGGISNWRCLRSPQDVPVLDGIIVEHRYDS